MFDVPQVLGELSRRSAEDFQRGKKIKKERNKEE